MIKTHSVYYPIYENKDKFIILITGGRGCEHPNTPVMMHDFTIKRIKDVQVGDFVMGENGEPRRVLQLFRGRDEMYRIHQSNAVDYIVNKSHKLVLKKSVAAQREGRYPAYGDVIEIPVSEYAKKSEKFKSNFYGYKTSTIQCEDKWVKIPPYLLGVWLGDGSSDSPRITNPDEEIKEWIGNYCREMRLNMSCVKKDGAYSIGIAGNGGKGQNTFLNALRDYDLIGNKHIPQDYIRNSEDKRLELLAGLLDSDGYFASGCYEIIQKRESIARGIKLIADTLGFRTSLSRKAAGYGGKDCGVAYRVLIGGDIWRIPCKVARKIAHEDSFHKNKDWRVSKVTVQPLGMGKYCGIMVDGNHRYLAGDGTVKRNSGKSFSASAFIERLTFELGESEGKKVAHQILFTRYTMTSAAISVIPEFLEKVNADGTTKYFRATRTDVENRMTKSKVMFRGIKTSSGVQTAKLKSIHGITTFVCDEAEEWVSEKEFETIMLSIRQKGIQNRIIIIMNPTDSNHFIYQRYLKNTHKLVEYDGVPVQISTHPNVLHIHTTYLDNKEFLSEQFLREVEDMKQNDPAKYAHIVIGAWSDVAEGAVFKKWGIVEEFPKECKKVAIGVDWGYTNDPTAIVKCGIVDNRLYLQELCYKTQMGIKDIIEELRKHSLMVYADSADPRLIDEVSLGGVLIYPVQKGPGSVIAGIEKMQSMEIFVTKDSYNLQDEMRNYTWDKDKDGNYINQPIDAYNHCLDSARYYTLAKLLGKVMKPRRINKSKTKLF